jgi:Cof subfamily protein (haloacid dehalogenase superfamily)
MKTDMNNIILLSDLDGTLLDSNSIATEKNKEAIKKFVELGGNFGIATGRGHQNALGFLDGVMINTPSIVYNGSMLYDFEQSAPSLVKTLPSKDLIESILWVMDSYKEVMVQIYGADMSYIVSSRESVDEEILIYHQPATFINLDNIMKEDWVKILISGKHDDLVELEKHLEASHLNDKVRWVFSSEIFLEILPVDVSKGTMLHELRKIYSADHKIIAIGDFYNDIEMIQEADCGIATLNAPEAIKNLSNRVTVSNDDSAVAEVIEDILANRIFS